MQNTFLSDAQRVCRKRQMEIGDFRRLAAFWIFIFGRSVLLGCLYFIALFGFFYSFNVEVSGLRDFSRRSARLKGYASVANKCEMDFA